MMVQRYFNLHFALLKKHVFSLTDMLIHVSLFFKRQHIICLLFIRQRITISSVVVAYCRASQTRGRDPLAGREMMFRGRREYINFTQSTAYTIVTVVTADTILHIL